MLQEAHDPLYYETNYKLNQGIFKFQSKRGVQTFGVLGRDLMHLVEELDGLEAGLVYSRLLLEVSGPEKLGISRKNYIQFIFSTLNLLKTFWLLFIPRSIKLHERKLKVF